MKRQFKATLRNEPWTIKRLKEPVLVDGDECDGFCCGTTRTIVLRRGLTGFDLLVTAIHEMLHAQFPTASEKTVTRSAEEIADVLAKIEATGWPEETKS